MSLSVTVSAAMVRMEKMDVEFKKRLEVASRRTLLCKSCRGCRCSYDACALDLQCSVSEATGNHGAIWRRYI